MNGGRVRPCGQARGQSVGMQALAMNGGVIETGKARPRLRRCCSDASVEATSTATQAATIRGDVILVLTVRPDLIVNNGPQPIDLSIDVRDPRRSLNVGVTKSGTGVARLTKDNTYTRTRRPSKVARC